MTCGELQSEYGAYALGVAEDPEHAGIQEHLLRHCPVCTGGVREALREVARLSGAVAPATPSPRLKVRIVAMVTPAEPRRAFFVWLPWAVSAALLMVLLSVELTGRFRGASSPDTRVRFEQAIAILSDPVTRDVAFGEPAARGRFFVSPARGVVFFGAGMPRLGPTRTFQLWLIPASGAPVPAGTFNAAPDATAIHVRPGPVTNAQALAVTVEPAGGSPAPTTTPFIVSKL